MEPVPVAMVVVRGRENGEQTKKVAGDEEFDGHGGNGGKGMFLEREREFESSRNDIVFAVGI